MRLFEPRSEDHANGAWYLERGRAGYWGLEGPSEGGSRGSNKAEGVVSGAPPGLLHAAVPLLLAGFRSLDHEARRGERRRRTAAAFWFSP